MQQAPLQSQVAPSTPSTVDSSDQNLSIDEVNRNSDLYTGRLVTVRSEVNSTDDRYSFLLDDEDGLNVFGLDLSGTDIDLPVVDVRDDKLLVFNASGNPLVLPEGEDDEVQVTGVLQPFVRDEVEQQFGITLDPEIYAEYESRPVLFAQSIAYAPDPGDVTADPASFYGQIIAVEGNVEEIYGSSAFSLNDQDLFDGEDLLVLSDGAIQLPSRAANVVVVGEVQPFVAADVERNYNLGLPDNLSAEYAQRPVIIVREIYPSAK